MFMPHSYEIICDLFWLSRRLCSMFRVRCRVSKRYVNVLQNKFFKDDVAVSSMQGAIKDLLANMHFETLGEWGSNPSHFALPMIAILPGIGCRILTGRTDKGEWLFEGPEGSMHILYIPEGAAFLSIRIGAHGDDEPLTAFQIFKETFASKKSVFMQVALASALCNIFALTTSIFSLQVYDRVVPTHGLQTLLVLVIGVSIVIFMDMMMKFARSSILEAFIKFADFQVSHKIFRRLLSIRMDQFPSSVGSLSSQIRSYESIRAFASSATLYIFIDAPFGLFFLLIIMGIAGPIVALLSLFFFLLSIAIGLSGRRKIEQHTKNTASHNNMKLGLLVESVEGAETIKSTGSGWQILNRWDMMNRQAIEDDAQTRHYSETTSFLSGMMQQLNYVFLVATGAYLAVTTTNLTMGGIIACSILSGRVLAPISMIPGLIVQWGHSKIALENLEKVFALERDNHEILNPITPQSLRGSYQLSEIKFSYKGRNDALCIQQFSVKAGEKVGILGVVGAGKSTLLKIMSGLYKPENGNVLLDGLDMQQISRSVLSEGIGYIPQHIHLFAGTLRDNLLLGVTGIGDAELVAACEATGLMQLVSTHPKGLDLVISEGGTGVSGGQKQLVAATRLLLSRTDIWLLDEPTASMDEGHELRVLNALRRELTPERTMILVTHKVGLLGLVDRLVVLTPGGIVMDGPREQVLNKLRQANIPAPGKSIVSGEKVQ